MPRPSRVSQILSNMMGAHDPFSLPHHRVESLYPSFELFLTARAAHLELDGVAALVVQSIDVGRAVYVCTNPLPPPPVRHSK